MPPNNRLLRALRRQKTDCTPVWIMRQAGRYLPEYRKTRAGGDFMRLCKTPALACEVTLQPLRRYALDAAILFSDILTIPDAMGLGLSFSDGVGPKFAKRLQTKTDIDALPAIDAGALRYVLDAVALIRRELDAMDDGVPLIGFSGSPWTLAAYMVEGGASKDFRRARALLHADPQSAHRLLDKLARAVADCLAAQAAAGAQALMIFDTWGGLLSTPGYAEFSLRYLRAIVAELKSAAGDGVPVILFTKGGGNWLEDLAATGCDAVGLDWSVPIGAARRRIGGRVALQGNLDPAALYASPSKIEAEVARIIEEFGPGPGHIFNLGHGIYPDTDPARVAYLVDAVHRQSGKSPRKR